MAKKKGPKSTVPEGARVLIRNRRATHDYHIHETIEAGMVLLGSEVKSLRAGSAVLTDGHVEFRRGEAWLVAMKIKEYSWSHERNHDPERPRKLLLHKREIARLATRVEQRGFALIPISLYLKNGKMKIELALASGKRQFEKREASREAEAQREIDRAMKRR